MAPHRIAALPDTPTMAEAGFPELTLGSWQGLYVPAGTPRPVVNALYAALMKTLKDPVVVNRLGIGGADVVTSKSPEEFAAFMKDQTAFWAGLIKQTGAAAD
jgi:tripartite-type tricarboxylate transporter receptor subunit TctC